MEPSADYFRVEAGRALFRPVGRVTLAEAVSLVDGAIAHVRTLGITRLMVNGVQLTGFPSPSLTERYFLVEKWARTADGAVRLSIVIRPEMLDPQKFGMTVAVNRRLVADVFVSEASAIAWLDSGDAPSLACTG